MKQRIAALLAAALLLAQGPGLAADAAELPGTESAPGVEGHQGTESAPSVEGLPETGLPPETAELPETGVLPEAAGNEENETLPEMEAGEPEDSVEPADNGESGIMPISGIEDITPPTVTGIQFGAETVEAPGTLEILVETADNVSGANSATVYFRNPDTGKELYTFLSATYYNQETGKETVYEDGKLHGKLEVNQYASAGTYMVKYVEIRDVAENYKLYYGTGDESYKYHKENEPESVLPETVASSAFSISNSGVADITAPTAKRILLDQETVEAPGQVQVTVEAEDDLSGVSRGMISFRNTDTGKELYGQLSVTSEGKLTGTLEVSQYTSVGNYVIEYAELWDQAENMKTYFGQGHPNYNDMKEQNLDSLLPEELKNISFSVINNGTVDITAPTVAGFTLKKDRVEVPAVIEVLVDGTDDISGVSYGSIYFRNLDTQKTLYAFVETTYFDYETGQNREYADGMLHGEIQISHYTGTGDYVVEYIELRDQAGNYGIYYGAGFELYGQLKEQGVDYLLPEAYANVSFYVYNDGKGFDVEGSTQTPNLVEQIKAADDQAKILVDYTNDSVLKKDIFDALKGTGKTISLVAGDGVQWIFQGTDIVNDSKDIDLRVSMEFITQSTGEAAEAIEELVEETKTVILRFPENGVLPGKAKIRVKADYSMRQYLGEEGIYVYYFDNKANELVPIAANLVLTDDYYIEFEIEHCSYYIMTAGQVEKEAVPEQPGNNPGQETEKPGSNGEQDKEKPENGKNDTAQGTLSSPTGQEAGQPVKGSPKTGEDPSGVWYLWGGIAVLAFLYLSCQKAGRNS